MTRPLTAIAACLRIFCALAVFALSFVHHPPVTQARGIPQADLAQYTLPDGTIPVLCLTLADDGSGTVKHVAVSECAACRIGNAVLLPAPVDLNGERLSFAAAPLWPPVDGPTASQRIADDAPPRAPPFGIPA